MNSGEENPWPRRQDTGYSNNNKKKKKKEEEEEKRRRLGTLLLFGATLTTLAVKQLQKTINWFYAQISRSQSSWKGRTSGGSFRTNYQEEAWERHYRRMQEEYEEEMQRVERIRRMQRVFNRERDKYRRSYERWTEGDPGQYHQHFQRKDWYWKTETSYGYQRTNSGNARDNFNTSLSHHYNVLGLDRSRTKPYTEEEIKTAFRVKAKQFHPDQNQVNKEAAEAKFKEVMTSYEAIKLERKNKQHNAI